MTQGKTRGRLVCKNKQTLKLTERLALEMPAFLYTHPSFLLLN